LSIACAGNINLDGITASNPKGIQDLVVGAPYDGPDHQGAIYIYLGTAEGIGKSHAQVRLLFIKEPNLDRSRRDANVLTTSGHSRQ